MSRYASDSFTFCTRPITLKQGREDEALQFIIKIRNEYLKRLGKLIRVTSHDQFVNLKDEGGAGQGETGVPG